MALANFLDEREVRDTGVETGKIVVEDDEELRLEASTVRDRNG